MVYNVNYNRISHIVQWKAIRFRLNHSYIQCINLQIDIEFDPKYSYQ